MYSTLLLHEYADLRVSVKYGDERDKYPIRHWGTWILVSVLTLTCVTLGESPRAS